MEIHNIVLKTIQDADHPLKGGEIVDKSGIEKKDVDKALKVLKNEDKIFCPKRCFYQAK